MTTLYFKGNESRSGGECYDPDDAWPSYAPVNVYCSWDSHCFMDVQGYPFDQTEIDFDVKRGDIVYAAIAYYSTGDTFSSSHGNPQIMLVSKESDVVSDYVDRVKADYAKNGNNVEGGWKPSKNLEFSYNVPWKGYFESLDDIEFRAFIVG